MTIPRILLAVALVSMSALGTAQPAVASVIGIGTGAFGAGSTLTTFTGLADNTPVHGLTVDGILFQYSLGSGYVVIGGGPDVANNVTYPDVLSIGNNAGTLVMTLPFTVDTFGYGYALLATNSLQTATTMSLFNGATAVGSLSYAGALDPTFVGGFAGIQSTIPFNRVEVTFNSIGAAAFAIDNVRTFNAVAVPDPASTLLLLGISLAGLGACRKQR